MLKYSVIVAVYNLEKYIEECLNSIIHQTYQNIEIIVVDDGSSDKSVELCQKIAANDRRVKVVCGKHGGVSVARNIGLLNITGDYVFFVDGDDFIEKDYVEKVDSILSESQVDILITNHYYYYDNKTGKRINKEMFPIVKEVKEKKIHILDYLLDNHYMLPGGVCFNVYKIDFLKKNNCYFVENIQWFEDYDFYLQVMSHEPTYEVTNLKYYYYRRKREGSAVSSVTTQKILDKMSVIRKWYKYVTEQTAKDTAFHKVKIWLQREYYVNFAFCIPSKEKNVNYQILEEAIMKDENIWMSSYPKFGIHIQKYGLRKILPVIKFKEYSKVILGIR